MPRSEDPSNAVLAEKIAGIHKLLEVKFVEDKAAHDRMELHLQTLNGSVAKNTEFRLKAKGYLAAIATIVSAAVSWIVTSILGSK